MKRLSRRAVLRGAGGVAIGLPLLEIMGSARNARAQSAPGYTDLGYPKRFIVMFSPNGTIPDAWSPSGAEDAWQLSRILAPLEPFKQKLIVIEGVDQQGGGGDGHQNGMGGMLTGERMNPGAFEGGNGELAGWANGISVDQRIAEVLGNETKFRSLELGVQNGRNATNWNRMSYLGPDQPVPPEQDPYAAFDRVFGEFTPPGTDSGPSLTELKDRTVLGAVMEQYRDLNRQLGAADRQKLEAHLAAISDIESRLGLTAKAATDACAQPTLQGPDNVQDNANYPAIGALQTDLLVMSLACDLTRVGSLMWNKSVGGARFEWLGIDRGHHDLSHDGDSNTDTVEQLTQINVWYAERFADLIGKLDAIPEGDGTMLDNCVVLWCNELGKGNSHTRKNAPYVLAGGGGGYLRTNRYLNYEGDSDVPHNNLLVTLINSMGIEQSTFGNPEWVDGPLDGLA